MLGSTSPPKRWNVDRDSNDDDHYRDDRYDIIDNKNMVLVKLTPMRIEFTNRAAHQDANGLSSHVTLCDGRQRFSTLNSYRPFPPNRSRFHVCENTDLSKPQKGGKKTMKMMHSLVANLRGTTPDPIPVIRFRRDLVSHSAGSIPTGYDTSWQAGRLENHSSNRSLRLPNELLLEIMERLPPPDLYVRTAGVSPPSRRSFAMPRSQSTTTSKPPRPTR